MRLLSGGGIVVDLRGFTAAPGAVRLHLADGVPLLRPDEQVFQAMLDGWRNQQLARNLARSTVEGRENTVKAFAGYVSAYPWAWTPAMVDEWLGDLRLLRDLKRSTIRSYSEAVRAFCTSPPTRFTGGRRPARSGSGRTRSRSSTSGTLRCTSRTTSPIRRSAPKAMMLHGE
jgi:hypothetical protein